MMEFYSMDEGMQHIHEQHQKHHQALEAQRHEIRRLFTELGEAHLKTLSDFLGSLCAGSPEGAAMSSAYFHGVSKIFLETRFNICSACGVDHDEAIKQVAGEGEVDGQLPLPIQVPRQRPILDVTNGTKERTTADAKVGEATEISQRQLALMNEYNLDDLREEGTGKLLGFVCLKCGKTYPSIEDRMMKPPGEQNCPGCVIQTKWG